MTLVFQFRLMVMSLYGLNSRPLEPDEVPPLEEELDEDELDDDEPPEDEDELDEPLPLQAPSEVQGWPLPTGPLLVAGSLPCVHQLAL
jgi:hypothetical protein